MRTILTSCERNSKNKMHTCDLGSTKWLKLPRFELSYYTTYRGAQSLKFFGGALWLCFGKIGKISSSILMEDYTEFCSWPVINYSRGGGGGGGLTPKRKGLSKQMFEWLKGWVNEKQNNLGKKNWYHFQSMTKRNVNSHRSIQIVNQSLSWGTEITPKKLHVQTT